MIIGIDFDGTCVTHKFPEVGEDIGAESVLKELLDNGHQLVLFTMRSDEKLIDAINWFKERNISLYGVNENPEQHSWTSSPKPYCHLYIDDAGLGISLKYDFKISDRGFVDWEEVKTLLISLLIIKEKEK